MNHSSQPDHVLLRRLSTAYQCVLAGLVVISVAALASSSLPVSTAVTRLRLSEGIGLPFAVLLASISLLLNGSNRSVAAARAGRFFGAGVMALSVLSLAARAKLLPAAFFSRGTPFYLPLPFAFALGMMSVVLIFLRVRRRGLATAVDSATFLLCLFTVTIFAGHFYVAVGLIRPAGDHAMSTLAVVCLGLLCIVTFGRRAEFGVFSVVVSTGIGGKIARVVLPAALALPFLRETARFFGLHNGWVTRDYGMVVATGIGAMLAFSVAMFMILRIDTLERRLQDLSLRDSLTGLYNRRGFYLFAEQALWLARRARKPFTVLYIDLDGLKDINDTFGHETGSEFIAEMADLLRQTFRETDAVGRIGGDEFAIAGDWSGDGMRLAARRLDSLVQQANARPGREFQIAFSMGHVTCEAKQQESLSQLLDRADTAMYVIKQEKKVRAVPPSDSEDLAQESPA